MANSLKWALCGLAAVSLLAQAVRFEQANPPVSADIAPPPEIAKLLWRACYDCHSNETRWPWYAEVAPVSWLVAHDVAEGRKELNLSTWDAYETKKRRRKLKESAAEIAEGEMPPWYYKLVHGEARLTEAELATLRQWFESERDKLPQGG